MDPKQKCVVGARFGTWTLLAARDDVSPAQGRLWLVRCDCGTTKETRAKKLLHGRSRGCATCAKTKARSPGREYKGEQFGNWLVVESTVNPDGTRKRYWTCRCSCGTARFVNYSNILSGSSKGCSKAHYKGEPYKTPEELDASWAARNSRPNPLVAEYKVFGRALEQYIQSAKTRRYDWLLTDEEAVALFKGDCFYCKTPASGLDGKGLRNGIDRKDNLVGYTSDNCVSCCAFCNRAKCTSSEEVFRTWISRITSSRAA